MLKYIFCLLFTLNSIFSYGSKNTFDEPLQRTSQQEFFSEQNNCLQQAVHNHSVLYEVRQRLIHKGIQMLQLPKLDIHIGGRKLSKDDLEALFKDQSAKFTTKTVNKADKAVDKFNGTVANTTILINLRAKKKLPDGTISEPQRISYFTTPDVFLSCQNLAEYCDQLAILNEWTYYSDFTIAVIPKGAHLQAMIGLTAAQESESDQYDEIVKEVGENKARHYTPKLGGAPQIYIAYASEYQVYDIGYISTKDFKKIRVRNVLTNQFSIYLPVPEFLNVGFHNSFKRIHEVVKKIYESPFFINPFSFLNIKNDELRKLFYNSNQTQKIFAYKFNNIPSLVTSHPNTKGIVPYKKPQKALLVLRSLSINTRVPHISLRHAYIAPLITRGIKMLK